MQWGDSGPTLNLSYAVFGIMGIYNLHLSENAYLEKHLFQYEVAEFVYLTKVKEQTVGPHSV